MSMEIDSNQTHIAVVGLGYVGLPTALAFHQAGFHVRGIDVSQRETYLEDTEFNKIFNMNQEAFASLP